MRLAVLVTATSLLLTGCVPRSSSARTPLMTAGAVATAVGVGLAISMAQDDEPALGRFDPQGDGPTDGDVGCLLGGCVLAAALATVGVGLFVAGAIPSDDEPVAAPTPPIATSPGPAALHPAQPALATAVAPVTPPIDLPALPTDATTLQYASSVRLAVQQEKCPLARILLREIHNRDPGYHAALVAIPDVTPCL